MYFKETELTTPKTILAIPDHYVAIPIMVGDTDVTADADGRKIVPAGTILGGGVIADRSQAAKNLLMDKANRWLPLLPQKVY